MPAFIPSTTSSHCPSPNLISNPPTCTLSTPSVSRRTAVLLLLTLPLPAQADRTGKYSTKLTAKRRYLPRIQRGITALLALQSSLDSAEAVNEFRPLADDMATAMALFATAYFSEGNKIGETERELTKCVQEFREGVSKLEGGGWNAAVEAVKTYVRVGKLIELGVGEGLGV